MEQGPCSSSTGLRVPAWPWHSCHRAWHCPRGKCRQGVHPLPHPQGEPLGRAGQDPTHPGHAGTVLPPSQLQTWPGKGWDVAVRKGKKGHRSLSFGVGETFATSSEPHAPSRSCISQRSGCLANCGMRTAGCTDVRCHALSDEEVSASGCLYMTYQNFLLHDEIIRGPSCRE